MVFMKCIQNDKINILPIKLVRITRNIITYDLYSVKIIVNLNIRIDKNVFRIIKSYFMQILGKLCKYMLKE